MTNLIFEESTGEFVGPTNASSAPAGYGIFVVEDVPSDLSLYKMVGSEMVLKTSAELDSDFPQFKAMAVHQVNQMVAAARVQYITDLPGQDAIYDAKRKEAVDFLALDPTPSDTIGFPFLTQEAGITAPTAYELAQLWVNLSDLWIPTAAQMEGLRNAANTTIAAATTRAEIDTALSNLTSQLGL